MTSGGIKYTKFLEKFSGIRALRSGCQASNLENKCLDAIPDRTFTL